MTVVRNEFEMGENNAGSVLLQRMQQLAFRWHNYGNPIIGERADIERVPIDKLQAFYRTWYQPDNAVLIVAGRFDEAAALALVAKHFGAAAEAEARAARALHRGADAGRRAQRDAAPRRRHARSSPRCTACRPRAIPTIRRSTCWSRRSATRRAAACTARWCRNGSPASASALERDAARPGLRRASAPAWRAAATSSRRASALIDAVEGLKSRADRRPPRSSARAPRCSTTWRRRASTPRSMVRTLAGVRRRWATGACSTSTATACSKVTLADVQRVAETLSQAGQPRAGRVRADRARRPRADPAGAGPERDARMSYRGGEGVQLGEAFDPSPKNIEARLVRARAGERHPHRAAAQDARAAAASSPA